MQDRLVSRDRECDELQRCLESDRSVFRPVVWSLRMINDYKLLPKAASADFFKNSRRSIGVRD